MHKLIFALAGGAMATAPALAAEREQEWLSIGSGNPDLELVAYIGGLAAVIAVVIAVTGGSDEDQPVSP